MSFGLDWTTLPMPGLPLQQRRAIIVEEEALLSEVSRAPQRAECDISTLEEAVPRARPIVARQVVPCARPWGQKEEETWAWKFQRQSRLW